MPGCAKGDAARDERGLGDLRRHRIERSGHHPRTSTDDRDVHAEVCEEQGQLDSDEAVADDQHRGRLPAAHLADDLAGRSE